MGFTWEGSFVESGLPGVVKALDVRPPEVHVNDDLWIYAHEAGEQIVLEIAYDTALFSRATLDVVASWLPAIVDQVTANDGVPLFALQLDAGDRAAKPTRRTTRYAL